MPHLPTGTITFLFTDIEGSTKTWEAYPEAMATSLARHDTILRETIVATGGTVFKTVGDGVYAAFVAPPEALEAVVEAQRLLSREAWPPTTPIRVRMALHTGVAELRDGDYFGTALNRVARLLAAGHGGQTLLSAATFELVRDRLPPGVELRNLGEHRLKDLTRPEQVFQLTHPDLRSDFPPLRSLNNVPNNLPQQITSLVGREKALAEVGELLSKTRLLTLTGAGGSGKTRLALQAAADALDDYPDGVWFVELAPLADPSLVAQTVASVLEVKEQAGKPMGQTLADHLKARRLLLVLDNCEHLLAACAPLVANLLRSCPSIQILATGREPLGIGGEVNYRVPSLSLPNPKRKHTIATLSQYEAVRLFIDRAQAVKPDFAVTNANAPALAQLCYQLDGIPLALELAAARVRSLPVEQINEKLDSRFRLLTGGDRSALPRQQTLRALVDWSYDLLSDQEKSLLARLSVFAGGWMLAAAEAVCAIAPLEDWEVLDLLTSLADKSLLLAEEENGASRYRMLETIRQYGAEKLTAAGETRTMRLRHRDWAVALAEEASPLLQGPEQVLWLNRLESEHDNLRAALEVSTSETGAYDASEASALRLSGALHHFWFVRGHLTEGRERLARAIASARERSTLQTLAGARALNGMGALAHGQGDYTAAQKLYEEGLAIFRALKNDRGIADSLINLGIIAHNRGDLPAAQAWYEESLALSRTLGDKRNIASALRNLGIIAYNRGDLEPARALYEEGLVLVRELGNQRGIAYILGSLAGIACDRGDTATARTIYEESLTIFRALGDRRGIAHSLINLGNVVQSQGDSVLARTLHEESLGIVRELGDTLSIACSLEGLAAVALGEGDPARAVTLWANAAALRAAIGAPLSPAEETELQQKITQARAALGDPAFTHAQSKGAAMTEEQAAEYALEKNETEATG